ncbi:MAG TPA: zinc dependent phospholipase C family protein [Spirochaetia bacterium]|nr:zinc dependent phospholipase C family protein [Spirochaetia bacterium]
MPSHVAHLVFAEEVVIRAFGSDTPLQNRFGNFLALGAQGPDVFFHNQRTMPTGIRYGILLHRHGYGKFVAGMVDAVRARSVPFESEAGAFAAGFLTHAILDRHTHPFINYFSGWVDPDEVSSARHRSMHPFFERIIDLFVLARYRSLGINRYNFFSRVDCGDELPEAVETMEAAAMRLCYRRARRDEELFTRLRNAYRDTMGYYRYSNRITPARLKEAMRREESGELGSRWLAILHPFALDGATDYLNEKHDRWTDPCDESRQLTDSFWDLFDRALESAAGPIAALRDAWAGALPLESLENAIGNGGLSDTNGEEAPCRKLYSRPLALADLLLYLRACIADDRIPDSPPLVG